MKKPFYLLIALLLAGTTAYSQKKSGTIYIEHEAIGKTQELWQAFLDGDGEKFRSFFADSAYISNNGARNPMLANEQIGQNLDYWKKNFDGLSIGDYEPAYPDALEYKEGGLWVQDWLLLKGIHRETGVVLNLPVHNIYAFNDQGQITLLVRYFNNDVFEEINNAQTTRENGKVYIHHPYIATVRKVMNAAKAGDIETWKSHFAPDARFMSATGQLGDSNSIDEHAGIIRSLTGADAKKFRLEEFGYPDCVYYDGGNNYVVYSWWKITTRVDGELYEFVLMYSHDFNDEGKIVRESMYGSSNHLQHLGS